MNRNSEDCSQQFALQQFATLREEIRETKARLFKVMTFGIVGVPAANYASTELEMPSLLLLLPALVVIIALMYLAENHGLMRCGRFIRLEIEPVFQGVMGWETWLETRKEHRSVDRYVAYSFFLLFLLYYGGTVSMALNHAWRVYTPASAVALSTCYVAIGIAFLGYLAFNVRTHAITSTEPRDEAGTSSPAEKLTA